MYINPLIKEPGRKKEFIFLSVFLFILCCSVYYFLFFIKFHPGKILEKALSYMEGNDEVLAIVMCEEGEGYRINFEGNVLNNGALYGKITDFDLELYCPESGKLLVKDLKDGRWKEASELGLQSLTALIHSPLTFLGACSPLFQKAKFLDNPDKTNTLISLQISPEFLEKLPLDKARNFGNELSLNCVVSVNQETSFIDEVNLSFVDKNTHKELFNRNFSFSFRRDSPFKTIYSSKP